MMGFNIKGMKITIDYGKVAKLDEAKTRAFIKTADYLKGEIINTQVIPFDKGTLQNTATFVDTENVDKGQISIVSSTPYARRLYFHPEYNFQTVNNPNAKGQWFEDWLPGGSKQFSAKEIFKKMYEREIKK